MNDFPGGRNTTPADVKVPSAKQAGALVRQLDESWIAREFGLCAVFTAATLPEVDHGFIAPAAPVASTHSSTPFVLTLPKRKSGCELQQSGNYRPGFRGRPAAGHRRILPVLRIRPHMLCGQVSLAEIFAVLYDYLLGKR